MCTFRQEPAACETRRLVEDEITVARGSAVGFVAPELLLAAKYPQANFTTFLICPLLLSGRSANHSENCHSILEKG